MDASEAESAGVIMVFCFLTNTRTYARARTANDMALRHYDPSTYTVYVLTAQRCLRRSFCEPEE